MTRVRIVDGRFGPRLAVSHVLSVSPEAAWRTVTDVMRWPAWSPVVAEVEASNRWIESGTTGRIGTRAGVWLPFVISECDPDRRRMQWSIAHLPAGTLRVDDLGKNRCRVVFELSPLTVGLVGTYLDTLERLDDYVADREGDTTADGVRLEW